MKALGYIRVSKVSQELSPEAQRKQIEAYCAFKGYGLEHIFVDAGTSGGVVLSERPDGAWLVSMLGSVDAVVFAKLDRAFRDVPDCTTTVRELVGAGKSVHFLDLGIDTSTPTGELFVTIVAAFAQFERRRISERITDALAVVTEQGRHIGPAPFGSRNAVRVVDGQRVDAGVLAPIAEEQAVVAEVLALRSRGLHLSVVADELHRRGLPTQRGGRWSPEMVRRIERRAR